jgi:hypothetical protein
MMLMTPPRALYSASAPPVSTSTDWIDSKVWLLVKVPDTGSVMSISSRM